MLNTVSNNHVTLACRTQALALAVSAYGWHWQAINLCLLHDINFNKPHFLLNLSQCAAALRIQQLECWHTILSSLINNVMQAKSVSKSASKGTLPHFF
jgi:hypothetical protein